MKPDATKYNDSPAYIRGLIESAGLSQRKAAELIGVNDRTMRHYCSDKGAYRAPYSVQFCLEVLATQTTGNRIEQ